MRGNAGLRAVGTRWRTPSCILREEEMVAFAQDWDPLPVHVDAHAAATGPFGERIASGLLTLAIYERLVVEAVYAGQPIIAARGLRAVEFLRPVLAGDELHAEVVVAAVRERARRSDVVLQGGLWRSSTQVLGVEVDLVVAPDL